MLCRNKLFQRLFIALATLFLQMVRACSYEVGGDVTNPRLANLIERARVASVPKVSLQRSLCVTAYLLVSQFAISRLLNAQLPKVLA
jgi:hypothetical protein